MTENFPPYNYINEKGELSGYYIEILQKIWETTGLEKAKSDIVVYPWARGIINLENSNKVCLFGMSISKNRKQKFLFVGKIPGTTICLISRKNRNYKFNTIADINRRLKKNQIGAVRADIGGETFLSRGGKKELLYFVADGEMLVKMLRKKLVDTIAYTDIPTYKIMKKNGVNRKDFEISFSFFKGFSGFAFNKKTDPSIIKEFKDAYDKLWKNGTVMKIRNKHINNL